MHEKFRACIPGFCDNGLSITRSGELLPSLETCGSTKSLLLKPAYLGKNKMQVELMSRKEEGKKGITQFSSPSNHWFS